MLLWPSLVGSLALILGSPMTARLCLDPGNCINLQINNVRFFNNFSPPPIFPPCIQLKTKLSSSPLRKTEGHHTHQLIVEIIGTCGSGARGGPSSDTRAGTPLLGGKAGRAGAAQPGEEKAAGRPQSSCQGLEGLRESWGQAVSQDSDNIGQGLMVLN